MAFLIGWENHGLKGKGDFSEGTQEARKVRVSAKASYHYGPGNSEPEFTL